MSEERTARILIYYNINQKEKIESTGPEIGGQRKLRLQT